MTGAIDIFRCEIQKYRELAAFLALKYINMGFPMYVTLTNIPIENLSPLIGKPHSIRRIAAADYNFWLAIYHFKTPNGTEKNSNSVCTFYPKLGTKIIKCLKGADFCRILPLDYSEVIDFFSLKLGFKV